MTTKEYLRQAYRLDQKINSDIEEVARLREMATSISSPVLGDKVQTSRSGDAPFVRSIEKILLLEEKIDREIDTLVDLKQQMREVIAAVPDTDDGRRDRESSESAQIGKRVVADGRYALSDHKR